MFIASLSLRTQGRSSGILIGPAEADSRVAFGGRGHWDKSRWKSLGRGQCPQKMFHILMSKWRIFVDSLVLNFVLPMTKKSKNNTSGIPDACMDLCKD